MKHLMRMKVAIVAAVCAVATSLSAATATVNGVTYEYQVVGNSVAIGNDDWEPAISTSTSGALSIPSKINGLPVTWIKNCAFAGCENLTSVTIPDGVTTLGQSAFEGCTSLRSVSMPDSVNNISYYTFSGCSSLTSVKMPKSLVYIGHRAFENCSSLRSISIPANVVKVGGCVFEGTQFLADKADGLVVLDGWLVDVKGEWPTSVSVPSGVKGIAEIDVDSKLASLSVPGSVVYNWIYGLTYTEWHKNKMANAGNGVVFSDGWVVGVKGTCPSSVVLPKGTKGILAYAFQDCASLKSITIPEGVSSVGFGAFQGCENLKSISLPSTVKALDSIMLGGASVSELTIPASVVYVGYGALMSDALRTLNFSGKPCAVDQSEGPYVVYDRSSTVGSYTSTYAKEWKAVLDSSGKWYGLTMKQKSGSNPSPKSSNGIFDSAQTFNGWLNNEYGYIDGTIQIRTAKAKVNRKTGVVTSKVRATIQYLDWLAGGEIKLKKATYSGTMEIEDECGYLEVEGRSGDSIYLEVSADGVYGDFRAPSGDSFEILAYRDLFSSKDKADKARAEEALAKWKKTLVFALNDCCCDGMDIFNVTIGAKGKTKVSGTLLGQKFSLTTQLVVGENQHYLPMVSAKSCGFHHLFGLEDDGTISDCGEHLSEDQYGTLRPLEGGNYYFFVEDVDELAYLVGGSAYDVYTEYIPDWGSSVRISTNGTKWALPKAGKVALDRYGDIDESKLGENPSGLKLSYKAKDGTFSGSFKAYMNKNGRPSAVTVSVSGVMIGREGYGTATVKRLGSVPVRINHETVLSIGL